MIRRPPRSTRTDALFPYTTLFRSAVMEVLSCIDNRIRFDRRIAVLQGLARLDPALRIVVTLSPPDRERIADLKDRPNIELTGRITASRARALFLQSKRSEEHTPELQSLMRISYAVFCLKKNDKN